MVSLSLVPVTILFEMVGIWSDAANTGRFPLGHDYAAFWAAAKLFAAGGADRLYDFAAYAQLQEQVAVRPGFLVWHYPPHYLFLLLPLAGLSFGIGYLAFTAVNLAALAAIGWRLSAFRGALGWAALFGAPVMAAAIVQGQNGAFFAACLVGGIAARESGRPWGSALLFALILAKPQYCLLLPIVLLARNDWGMVLRTAVCCAGFTALATLVLGTAVWEHFFHNIRMLGYSLTEAELLAQMPTVWASLRLAGVPVDLAAILHGGVALAAVWTVWHLWREPRVHPDLALAALLFGTLMISPYGFRYDMVLTLGGTLLLIRHARLVGLRPTEKLVLAAMWLVPALYPALALATSVQVGPLISIAGLTLCFLRSRERHAPARSNAQPPWQAEPVVS